MGKLDTVEVNGPEGDVVDWDAVDWRAVEDDVRRLRHRIFTEGLLEPGASKRRTPGSEGAAAQQCAAATRLDVAERDFAAARVYPHSRGAVCDDLCFELPCFALGPERFLALRPVRQSPLHVITRTVVGFPTLYGQNTSRKRCGNQRLVPQPVSGQQQARSVSEVLRLFGRLTH